MNHPITIHESNNGTIYNSPFKFRNLLAEIIDDESFILDIRCSQEMLGNEEFEVSLEFEDLGIIITETVSETSRSGAFRCYSGDNSFTIKDAASFWRWVAICGKKALTTSNL